jgi:redox-sensitive bicupin YhaK (pirin superfamily)
MLVFRALADADLTARAHARLLAFGGEPLGRRYIWWNFVSSRKERIAQAAEDWQARRFAPIADETEFIPLPGNGLRIADYP